MTGARIAVLGAGAWGTALAQMLLVGGKRPVLWGRDAATVESIAADGHNERYLPGIALGPNLAATTDLAAALDGVEAVLSVVPAQATRDLVGDLAAVLAPGIPVVLCAKGIERGSGRLLSEIVAERLPNPLAALSGPSFAADVARGLPTAVTIAAGDLDLAARLAALLSCPTFRCYSSDDLSGVEVAGALKNVLAIAAGAVSGAGFGASAQAAIVTRGFVEIRRMASAFNAQPETLMGLAGLGDLMLTCNSPQSRNFAYGVALGRGEGVQGLPLAEGAATAGIAARIARERGIAAPIIEAVDLIVAGKLTIADAVEALLSRPLRSEID